MYLTSEYKSWECVHVEEMLRRVCRDQRTLAATSFNRVRVPDKGCVYVRGLLAPIASDFFPYVRVSRQNKKKQAKSRVPQNSIGQSKVWKRGSQYAQSEAAKRRGLFVHGQIEQIVKGVPPEKLHPYTEQIKRILEKQKLTPLVCELPIVSQHGVYYTKADLVCMHTCARTQEKEVWVVSLKTGYDSTIVAHTSHCTNECFKLRRSVKNQHLMQVACEMYSLKYEYGIDVKRGIVIYAGFGPQRSACLLKCPKWVYNEGFLRRIHEGMRQRAPQEQRAAVDALHSGLE